MLTEYQKKLRSPKWQKVRLKVLERDEYTCKLCGDKETTLHIHHKKYTGNPWDAPLEDLSTYCKHCHSVVEYNKGKDHYVFCINKKYFKHNDTTVIVYFYVDEENSNHVDFYFYTEINEDLRYVITLTANTLTDILEIINKF